MSWGGIGLTLLAAFSATAVEGPEALEQRSRRGPVQAVVRLTPSAPVIGDALVFEIEVTAELGVELLMPEFGEALDRFAIVDFAPHERIDESGRTVATQRYTLQSSRSGTQSIPPILIEFVDRRPGRDPAPEAADAYELLTERLEFDVASALPEDGPQILEAALGELPRLKPQAPPPWPFVLAGLVLAAAAAPFALRAWQRRRTRQRQRSAYQIARADLDELLYGARPGDAPQMHRFFVDLSGIVRRYLEDRFRLHSPELTTEEFLGVMSSSPDLSRDHQQLLQTFLTRADLVKFAHHIPEESDVEDSIRLARRFLEETRESVLVAERVASAVPPSSEFSRV